MFTLRGGAYDRGDFVEETIQNIGGEAIVSVKRIVYFLLFLLF